MQGTPSFSHRARLLRGVVSLCCALDRMKIFPWGTITASGAEAATGWGWGQHDMGLRSRCNLLHWVWNFFPKAHQSTCCGHFFAKKSYHYSCFGQMW